MDAVLDTAPCGFLAVDEAGTIRLANTTLAEMVGATRRTLEGAHMDRLLSSAGRIFYSTHLFPLLRLHGRAEEVYIPLRDADGRDVPVLVNAATRERDGEVLYDLILVPMRQRNELENELIAARNVAEQAASTKDRFLSIVSHELRTPIAAVSGYADLLLRERRGPLTEEQRRYVMRIADAARYQTSLITDILDFAGQSGARALQPTRLAVEDALARAEALLAVRAEEEDRRLRRHPVPAPGTMRADGQAVQQILLNLGVNAIKFSPPRSEVLITSQHDGRLITIGVHDSGPGIAEDHLERIFEPFVQLDAAADGGPRRRGVGLGLAISRDLARAMGGEVRVASAVGLGSVFSLELPAAHPRSE